MASNTPIRALTIAGHTAAEAGVRCPPFLLPALTSALGPVPFFAPRAFSSKSEHTVYSGPTSPSPKRITLRTLRAKFERGELLSVVTAYDYPSAVHVRLLFNLSYPAWSWF